MKRVHHLIAELTESEARLRQTTFLAPCAARGSVCVRVAGLVYTFTPDVPDFEGWGLFRPVDAGTAVLVHVAALPQVSAYLQLLRPLRLCLAYRLRGRTWLAYPANASDAVQKLGRAAPVPVHLVDGGRAFEQVVARWDGTSWWFDAVDRRADPRKADRMRAALKEEVRPEFLHFPGLTPEMCTVYGMAFGRTAAARAQRQHVRDQRRLEGALAFSGGRLRAYHDRGGDWLVEWSTPDGEVHTSTIRKEDLTVVSAGICLSGNDRAFDLQSLVGVMEQRPDWM